MRLVSFFISACVTLVLVYALNQPWGTAVPMPLGSFFSPQTGFWQNAENVNADFGQTLHLPQLKENTRVYFDERLVPHVFAENDEDLYFVQGYLHARFRLFQMDAQTRAAEGRVSEMAGASAIAFDREQRRLGMKYAAEHSLRAMEQDPQSRAIYSAYTAGINAYIKSLKKKDLPLEYKLLNVQPQRWDNLRTALLLKMMAKMLASGEYDLDNTRLKSIFTHDQISTLFPQVHDSLLPIVPAGTVFSPPTIQPSFPASADSAYFFNRQSTIASEQFTPNESNGSNNWVLAGKKTASGFPILCDDPHLELSFPSIWYEMQLSTPQGNAYGVTLPGSPFVIIGFNDSIAWGVTNAQRDVKDFYSIRFKDETRKEYRFNNRWEPAQQRIESIYVKNGPTVFDTVSYTVFGPVMFDAGFAAAENSGATLAVKWAAHQTGDDGLTFYKLNHAGNYSDYLSAIKTFECPGQNFIFASATGDIAIWQQGKFPARWNGQGQYIMPGADSSYMWQGFIPQQENPHVVNPERGFLQSANQRPAAADYPYFIPGGYLTARGIAIEKYLQPAQSITVQGMMDLQNNLFNVMAQDMLPVLMSNAISAELNANASKYYAALKSWDLRARPASAEQTIYQTWFDSLQQCIWSDEFAKAGQGMRLPDEQTTMELLKKDSSALGFVDDINTPEAEDLRTIVTRALNRASVSLAAAEQAHRLEWGRFKNVSIYHLLKPLESFARTGLNVGGWGNTINAMKKSHGPSWRMIVHLSTPTEAFGIYPGGQSGNPGSRYYDNAVDTWARGKYFNLWMMKADETSDKRIKWRMQFLAHG